MARALKSAGLSPFTELAQEIRVLAWILDAGEEGGTLASIALSDGSDPAVRYRLTKKVTGLTWTEVNGCGRGWLLVQFLARLYANSERSRPSRSQAARASASSR